MFDNEGVVVYILKMLRGIIQMLMWGCPITGSHILITLFKWYRTNYSLSVSIAEAIGTSLGANEALVSRYTSCKVHWHMIRSVEIMCLRWSYFITWVSRITRGDKLTVKPAMLVRLYRDLRVGTLSRWWRAVTSGQPCVYLVVTSDVSCKLYCRVS